MDYEKAYKELIWKLRTARNGEISADDRFCVVIDSIVPGLEDSEDERIRKNILALVKKHAVNHERCQMETYLEKLTESRYKNESVLRIKGLNDGEYLLYNYIYSFCAGEGILMSNTKGDLRNYVKRYYPELKEVIIKEQKAEWSEEDEAAFGDLMWCIEQARKSAKDENDMGNIWFAEKWVKERIKSFSPQSKQEWSGEDDKMLTEIINSVNGFDAFTGIILQNSEQHEKKINWLKSLRHQPKQEWSEEDERMRKAVLDEIEHQIEIMPDADDMDSDDQDRYNELISMSVWMQDMPKCMKPHWKPSDEQIRPLEYAIEYFKKKKNDTTYLESLLNDLNKL